MNVIRQLFYRNGNALQNLERGLIVANACEDEIQRCVAKTGEGLTLNYLHRCFNRQRTNPIQTIISPIIGSVQSNRITSPDGIGSWR